MMSVFTFFKSLRKPTPKALLIALTLGMTGVGLAGCITLLPDVKPVQLYTIRFNPELVDRTEAPEVAASADVENVDIFLNLAGFPRAASGDRIMTSENNEVAYVAGGRWASAAQNLFRDLLSEGFAREAKTVRVTGQGRILAQYRLDVEVRRFEAVYNRKRPTITVALDARLVRNSDRVVIAQRYISSDVALRKSDLSMMVEGFEKASSQAVVGLIRFAEEATASAKSAEALPPPAPPEPVAVEEVAKDSD